MFRSGRSKAEMKAGSREEVQTRIERTRAIEHGNYSVRSGWEYTRQYAK